MKVIKPTFFDALNIAGAERIHSQTIAWIFSLPDTILSDKRKSKTLCKLFGIETNQIFSNIKADTEIGRIDILINSDNYQFAVEIKLTSSEHTEQTNRYEIPLKLRSTNKQIQYAFLTLTDEKAKNQNWKNITFKELKNCLEPLKDVEDEKVKIFLSEYIDTLDNLTSVFEKFLNNPCDFPNVFKDGNKSKHEKETQKIDVLDYVRTNQLETIFQKAFLHNLTKDFPCYVEIRETRGVALAQIVVDKFKYKDTQFDLGLQLQGKTLKINLRGEDYGNSTKDLIDTHLTDCFERTFRNQNTYRKLNNPKRKAYLSVSRRLPIEIYEFEKQVLIRLINNDLKFIEEKRQDFYKLL